MLRISTKSQYGLRAMVYLAKSKKEISPLKELSQKEGIPFDYLEKIIGRLEKAGLVSAKKGVQGGYFLKIKPSKIKIGKIVRSLENKTTVVKCLDSFCSNKRKCQTRGFWQKIQKSLDHSLDSITLADLVKSK